MPAKTYEDYVKHLKKTQPGAVAATEKEWNKIKQHQPTTGADTWLKNFAPAVKKEIAKQKETGRTKDITGQLETAGLTVKEIARLKGKR